MEGDAARAIEVDDLIAGCAEWLRTADGVTISGGEPFDQPEALAELLRALRPLCAGDLLVYSGYSYQTLRRAHAGVLALADALVSEPYREDQGQTRIWRGSDNQRFLLLTELARAIYPADIDTKAWCGARRFDVFVGERDVWLAGIPRPGDLERLRAALRARGFQTGTTSNTVAQ